LGRHSAHFYRLRNNDSGEDGPALRKNVPVVGTDELPFHSMKSDVRVCLDIGRFGEIGSRLGRTDVSFPSQVVRLIGPSAPSTYA
jgi:hypothetical protein